LSCFGWIFALHAHLKGQFPRSWESCDSLYFFCESQRMFRWSNSVKGRARILKEKEERNASPVSAFCFAKDRPSRKLFIPLLWLGNLNFRSHIIGRKRESERDFLRQIRLTRAFFTSPCDMFSKIVSFIRIANQNLRNPRSKKISRQSKCERNNQRGILDSNARLQRKRRSESSTVFLFPPMYFILFAQIYTRIDEFNFNDKFFKLKLFFSPMQCQTSFKVWSK